MAGLVPATPITMARPCPFIGVAGPSPAMTELVAPPTLFAHSTAISSAPTRRRSPSKML
jgi:hypothetical protein